MDKDSNYWNTSSRSDELWYCCYWTGHVCVWRKMWWFGKCSHNELYALKSASKVWRKIPCTDGPMEKYGCGFISYSYQGTDYLLALGGAAEKQPTQQQQHSLYIPSGGSYYTNEIHTMEMTSSQGNVYMYNYYSVILIIIIIILINPFFKWLFTNLKVAFVAFAFLLKIYSIIFILSLLVFYFIT